MSLILNVVEMLLLISMAHLEKCNSIPYNFESIYEEYCKLLRLEDEGGSIGVSTYTFTKKDTMMIKSLNTDLAIYTMFHFMFQKLITFFTIPLKAPFQPACTAAIIFFFLS